MNRCVMREIVREIWEDGIKPGCTILLLSIPVIAAFVAWEYIKEHGSAQLIRGIVMTCCTSLAIVLGVGVLSGMLDTYRKARKRCGLD